MYGSALFVRRIETFISVSQEVQVEVVLHNAVHNRIGLLRRETDVQGLVCEDEGRDTLHDRKDILDVIVMEQRIDKFKEGPGIESSVRGQHVGWLLAAIVGSHGSHLVTGRAGIVIPAAHGTIFVRSEECLEVCNVTSPT